MKIAVCDDEVEFLNSACSMILKWAEKYDIHVKLYRFDNGDDLINIHKKECMDIIFLDIVMPLFNGIDTAKELRSENHNVPIVFLTSSREFAVESYEVKALNYLLKPVDESRMFDVLENFRKEYQKKDEYFTAKIQTGFIRIKIKDIEYLEAQNKTVIVHLTNSTTIEIRELFSKCENIFSIDNVFFKCHRSYIVNMEYVEQFTKSQIITYNKENIPISRNNYVAFKEVYFEHMFND